MQSYVERAPRRELADVVRTVWILRTRATEHTQRHLPTGGLAIQCTIGSSPHLLGPLTTAVVQVLPPGSVTVGVRFHPGAATAVLGRSPAEGVLDEAIPLSDLWGRSAVELGERLAATSGPVQALDLLQRVIATASRAVDPPDPVVAGAIARLLPGGTVEVGEVARSLAISRSQLRRRCLHALGIGPKTLQRTLRFQRYLALAQAASQDALRLGDRRTASLAAVAGYADQPHLVRECGRLAGVTPSALLGLDDDRCGCGHDHTASFRSFLAPGLLARHRPPVEHLRHSFKRDPVNAS